MSLVSPKNSKQSKLYSCFVKGGSPGPSTGSVFRIFRDIEISYLFREKDGFISEIIARLEEDGPLMHFPCTVG